MKNILTAISIIYGYNEENESHAYLLYVLALSSVTTGAAVSRS